MPKPSNDSLVQRHRQLRATLINKHARIAAEGIVSLLAAKRGQAGTKAGQPSVEEIATVIAGEFLASPV